MSTLTRFCLLTVTVISLTSTASAQASPKVDTTTGVISGCVTINDRPAPRIPVVIEPFNSPPTRARLPKTVTDEEGNYRLRHVPEGRYVVKPMAPSLVIADCPGPEQPGSIISSGHGMEGFILTVARKDVIEHIDFTLTLGGVITGRVTDDEGRPVIATSVYCYRLNERGEPDGSSSERFETDDRGVYRIYGLPDGNYVVSVSGAGNAARYPLTFHPDTTDKERATPVEVTAGGESSDVDIRLGKPESSRVIRGRVVDDATGQAVSDVFIDYRGSQKSGVGSQGAVMTRAEGIFEINAPPGQYKIGIATTGPPDEGYYSDPVTVEVSDADVNDVEVRATRGASVSGMIVVEGANDLSLVNKLTNTSLSASRLLPPEVAANLHYSMLFKGTIMKPGGGFKFTGLRPGKTKIRPDNLPQEFAFLRVERGGAIITDALDISPGEKVTGVRIVVAYGTGSVRGQAKIEGGTPPFKMGWVLEVRRDDGEQVSFQLLDARGQFWVKGLAPGTYEVVATIDYAEIPGVTPSPYPAPVKQRVTVEKGRESHVSLTLDLGAGGKK